MSFQYGADDFAPIELKSAEDGDVAELVTKALGDFSTTVKEMITKANERVDHLEAKLNRPAIITKSADDEPSIEQKAFSTFLAEGPQALDAEERKTLSVGTSTAGGYLVPQNFRNEIIKNLVEFSPVRSVATVSTVEAGLGDIILPKRTGKPTAAWVTETGARAATESAYGQQTISLAEAGCYVDISRRLLEDSAFGMESEIARDLAEEFGRLESAAFVNGTGTNQPKGFMAETFTSVTTAGSVTIAPDDLINVYHSMPTAYASRGTWVMNRDLIATVRKFKNTGGDYLWQDSLRSDLPATFLGRPVLEMIDMPALAANATPIVFGDFSNYRIFDRVDLQLIRDDVTQAVNGIVRFHARRRVGAATIKTEAFRALKIKA